MSIELPVVITETMSLVIESRLVVTEEMERMGIISVPAPLRVRNPVTAVDIPKVITAAVIFPPEMDFPRSHSIRSRYTRTFAFLPAMWEVIS
ncbi:MAG: hypothetical protein ABIS84_12085 [Arachnia sp.]